MEVTKISQALITDACEIPFFDMKVQAGSPSPADGHMCNRLDLNRHLIKNPNATFFVQVTGESMIDAGIKENDLLVVDRAIEATNNKIVIAVVNNEFTVKRLKIINNEAFLMPENPKFLPIKMEEGSYIWGVVTSVIQKF
ncbi:S24/S26 superfamily peptidase [Candidatus Trichorickettsia mobilis]|uniref:S24/S26 superfamily peptidase n=1 Tax=Candidatus Trichorickettsia mobilis TaxID=1346319 RepID=A0ABZ0UQY3_9RICK|nr:translesion error-prone DNA polymerase V autoproteolytic subunit [Candidatus Trichorickettsia mobilis]WPY00231.1 S24/S26 superfamily peptidase [Candidatus Trichorickettsia mobilis]